MAERLVLAHNVYGPATDVALVLLHGWGSESGTWVKQLGALAAQYRVVTVDLPGHGLSARSVAATIPVMASEILALVVQLGIDRAVLIGHSMGANVAVAAALRTHVIAGLVLIDPAYGADRETASAVTLRRLDELRAMGPVAAAGSLKAAFSSKVDPQVLQWARDTILAVEGSVLIQSLQSTYLDDGSFGTIPATDVALGRLRQPVLAIHPSSRDPRVVHRAVQNLSSLQVDIRSHFLHMESPQIVNDRILAWLHSEI